MTPVNVKPILLASLVCSVCTLPAAVQAGVVGASSNTAYLEVPSDGSNVPNWPQGKAGIQLPTTGNPHASSPVVGFAAGPIRQTNLVVNNAANGHGRIVVGPPGTAPMAETWKHTNADGTVIYAYRQLRDALPGFPQFGGEVIAKVNGMEVYYGEWAPKVANPVQSDSTNLNMYDYRRSAYYVGENPTTNMPQLTNAKYDVTGIRRYNPGSQAGVYKGTLTANYANGSGRIDGKLKRGWITGVDFNQTTIQADGKFSRGSDIEGHFFGNQAQGMAGVYKNGTNSMGFGGRKR